MLARTVKEEPRPADPEVTQTLGRVEPLKTTVTRCEKEVSRIDAEDCVLAAEEAQLVERVEDLEKRLAAGHTKVEAELEQAERYLVKVRRKRRGLAAERGVFSFDLAEAVLKIEERRQQAAQREGRGVAPSL